LNQRLACIERLIPRQRGTVSKGDGLHRDIDQFADDHGDHQQPRCLWVQMQFAEARRQELAERIGSNTSITMNAKSENKGNVVMPDRSVAPAAAISMYLLADGLGAASVAKPPAVGNGHHNEDFVRAGCVGDRHRYRVEMRE